MPSKASKPTGQTAFESRLSSLHTYLLSTLTAHTLKDLEKSLPSTVPGITSMNTKDHIQALIDESLLRTEKIGTGNWYWCFGSDTRIQRERSRDQITTEHAAITSRLETLRDEVALRKSQTTVEAGEESERVECQDAIASLQCEVRALKNELALLELADPVALQVKREEIHGWKNEAEVWTDNCYILEGWMRDRFGVGREEAGEVLRGCYGNEFGEEEGGLVDLA